MEPGRGGLEPVPTAAGAAPAPQASPDGPALSRGGAAVRVAAAAVVLMGAVGATVSFVGAPPRAEAARLLAAAALGLAVAGPGLVALVVARRCPTLLFACGATVLPRVVLSFSPLFLPLLPAAVVLLSGSSRPCPSGHGIGRHLVGNVLLVVLSLAAVAALFAHADPVSGSSPGGGTWSSSDVISAAEAAWSIGLTLSAVAVGQWLARPGARRNPARRRAAISAASASST